MGAGVSHEKQQVMTAAYKACPQLPCAPPPSATTNLRGRQSIRQLGRSPRNGLVQCHMEWVHKLVPKPGSPGTQLFLLHWRWRAVTILEKKQHSLDQWFSACGPWSAASTSPGNLLEKQILRLHPRPSELATLGVQSDHLWFSKPILWTRTIGLSQLPLSFY